MKVRYKNHPDVVRDTNRFNPCGVTEVEMGDDTVPICDLDVFVDGKWKDMWQAFKDKDILPNNPNTHFGVPSGEEAKARGWNW